MVRKIKKFKISLRPSYVARLLKKKLNSDQDPETWERQVEEEIARVEKLLVPTAVFETYSRPNTPEPLSAIWKDSTDKTLSVSCIASTIGLAIEKELEAARGKNDDFKAALLDSIAREALDQSTQFVVKILGEESKTEGCEISPPWLPEPVLLKELLNSLEAQKADILLDGNERIIPVFSRVSVCYWNPPSKSAGK